MKYKKNLLIFCPSIEEGGVEKNLFNISNSLTKEYNVSLITANKDKKKYFSKSIKFITTKNLNLNKKSRFLKNVIASILLFKYLNKKNIVFSFQSNILAIAISKIFCNKVIVRSNTSPNKYVKNIFKRIIFFFFFNLADKVIVNSKEFAKEFYKFFKIKPITIYNPIENISYLKKQSNKDVKVNFFKDKNNTLKILSIGRLVRQKDHLTILRAINEIKDKKKIKFCLIGKGNQEYMLKKFIKTNNLSGIVKLIGYKKNIYPYLKNSDLFILSSIYEGLPNTLIEALSFGIPILSTNCKTGPKEILNKKKYGKLFNVGDYIKLSKLILKFNKKKKISFVNDERFNYKKIINQYKNVINSI